MAKLIRIMAASLGGGIVLGAGIRLGETIFSPARVAGDARRRNWDRAERPRSEPLAGESEEYRASVPAPEPLFGDQAAQVELIDRLDRLEARVARLASLEQTAAPPGEWQAALASVVERTDRQQADVESIRHQVSLTTGDLDSVDEIAGRLRDELHQQLSEDLDRRLAAVEEQLHLTMKTTNRETVNAMVASIEARVSPRISRMESDIGEQASAVAELRECSLQSERSIQRLLVVLERVMKPNATEAGPGLSVASGR
jgi:hypothetical protein